MHEEPRQMTHDLKERRVFILRPEGQSSDLRDLVVSRGGVPVVIPAMTIRFYFNQANLEQFFDNLSRGAIDYVVLTSVNGVNAIFEIASRMGRSSDLRNLERTGVIVIGPKTAARLRARGIPIRAIPIQHNSNGLLDLFGTLQVSQKTVVLLRARKASELLVGGLRGMGAKVSDLPVYETVLDLQAMRNLALMLEDNKQDIILFTSSSSVRSLLESASEAELGRLVSLLNQKVIGSIGSVTTSTLRESGIDVDVEATDGTVEDLLEGVAIYLNRSG